jgi:hypothetical protein
MTAIVATIAIEAIIVGINLITGLIATDSTAIIARILETYALFARN